MAAEKSGVDAASGSSPSKIRRLVVAKTDLYDERRREFLVQYPIGVFIGLVLAGVLAFALTGFLGYHDQNEPAVTQTVFSEAWPLFLWFCALIMGLQISILRHPSLRRELTATLLVTLISIVIVGILYYFRVQFLDFTQHLLDQLVDIRVLLPQIGGSKWLYFIINFGLITIFWLDTVRRWIRRARGLPIHTQIDSSLEGVEASQVEDEDEPSLQELISGDLIAGALLTFVLSLIFKAEIITWLSQVLQVNVPITSCTVSWPFGVCPGPGGGVGGGLAHPPTLTFIDLIQSLIYLLLGLLILALSATLAGPRAILGVNERDYSTPGTFNLARPSFVGVARAVATGVAETVLDALRAARNRRVRLAAGNLLLSLRNAAWPALIFVGVLAAASVARNIRLYLHILSDERTCGQTTCAETLQNLGSPYQYIGLAILWGAVAILCIVFSVALLIFNRRVVENTMRFLGPIGLIVLLTLWIFSLALSGFNLLLIQLNITNRVPFPQPDVNTTISLAALVIWGIIVVAVRLRNRAASRRYGIPLPAILSKSMVRRVLLVAAGLSLAAGLAVALVGGYAWHWSWVGVAPAPASGAQPSKTLWDWLSLLIVPLVLAGAGYWFSRRQSEQQERRAAEERRDTVLRDALDRLGEAYLRDPVPVENVRAHLLATLRQLDGERRSILMGFLNDANRDTKRHEYDLSGARLENTELVGFDLARFTLVNAHLTGASLAGTHLEGAYLVAADLTGASLAGAQLQGASLTGARLQGADLTGAQLQGADLTGAQLQGANLEWAQLQGADLTEARLQGANLEWAQLQGATLREARLEMASLTGAQLQGANLSWAYLAGASLYKAKYNDDTQWPDGFDPGAAEAVKVEEAEKAEKQETLERKTDA